MRIDPQIRNFGSDTCGSEPQPSSEKGVPKMGKILISLVFSMLPAQAQVNSILPAKSMNIGEMAAPPAVSGFNAATISAEKAGPPGRALYRWSIAAAIAANAA